MLTSLIRHGHMFLLSLLTVGALSTPSLSFAQRRGTSDGGGGHRIQAEFRSRAQNLIEAIDNIPMAGQSCSASTMRKTLLASEIKVVDVLRDLKTNEIVEGYDAWTHPNFIQLREKDWKEYFSGNKSVDRHILHEVYRSTGVCDDESYKLSNEVLKILKTWSRTYRTYKFIYKYPVQGISDKTEILFCDQHAAFVILNCLYIENGSVSVYSAIKSNASHLSLKAIGQRVSTGEWGDNLVFSVPENKERYKILSFKLNESPEVFKNLLQQSSQIQPFRITIDLRNGEAGFGLSGDELIKF